MNAELVKVQLTEFILPENVKRPVYPLADDEPLITGGLINSPALTHVAVFNENNFHVYIPDTDFTVNKMDASQAIGNRVMVEVD